MNLFDAVRQAVPIAQVAAQHTHDRVVIPQAGGRSKCRCVCGQHRDTTPSVVLYPDESGHCFSCGAHFADVIALKAVAQAGDPDAASDTRARTEAARVLAADFNVSFDRSPRPGQGRQQPCARVPNSCEADQSVITPWAHAMLEETVRFYEAELAATPEAMALLTARGLNIATIQRMRLGYASGRGLSDHLLQAKPRLGLPKGLGIIHAAQDIGVLKDLHEHLDHRLVIPVLNKGRRPQFLIGRATQAGQEPKYLNLANSAYLRRLPMGWGRPTRGVICVEGPLDAAALLQWGLDQDYWVISQLGTGFRPVIMLLGALPKDLPIIVALDQDMAGMDAAKKVAAALATGGHTEIRIPVDLEGYGACMSELGSLARVSLDLGAAECVKAFAGRLRATADVIVTGYSCPVGWGGAKDLGELLARGAEATVFAPLLSQ